MGAARGRTRLLVLQPTPGCNIDCAYCYLPGRTSRAVMSVATMRAAIEALRVDGLLGRELRVAWHAGEPLMLPAAYYADALPAVTDACGPRTRVTHLFQTNAIAVTDAHVAVLAGHLARVGVSLDGPADLHDARRRTRSGRGSHALTVRGLQRLQRGGLNPSAICVVTAETLPHGARLIRHFRDLGVDRVALNFEEDEGTNRSSLAAVPMGDVHAFLRDVYAAARALEVRVREFEREALFDQGAEASDDLVRPFGTVSVDWQGGYSTFSPELLPLRHPRYGAFVLGSVHGGGVRAGTQSDRFRTMARDLRRGVAACRRTCTRFDRCRGGAPSNKLAEAGTFAVAETLSCRLRQHAVHEVVRQLADRPGAAVPVTSSRRA